MTGPADRDDQIAKLQADVAGLRARLRRVEQDGDAARTLAAVADRDVGEIGSEFRTFRDQNNRVLSAMRADLVDMRDEMRSEITDLRTEMRSEFADVRAEMRSEITDLRTKMRSEFADVRAEMRSEFTDVRAEMRQGFATAAAGQQQVLALLESLVPQSGESDG